MTTMEIEHAVVEKLRTLPAEKQQEVLDFADFLVQKTTITPETITKKPRISSEGILADLNTEKNRVVTLWAVMPI